MKHNRRWPWWWWDTYVVCMSQEIAYATATRIHNKREYAGDSWQDYKIYSTVGSNFIEMSTFMHIYIRYTCLSMYTYTYISVCQYISEKTLRLVTPSHILSLERQMWNFFIFFLVQDYLSFITFFLCSMNLLWICLLFLSLCYHMMYLWVGGNLKMENSYFFFIDLYYKKKIDI